MIAELVQLVAYCFAFGAALQVIALLARRGQP